MKRRAFLLGLIAAPAAPLAAKWAPPRPDYGRALAASALRTKWVRQATMYNWAENTVQAHARDVYREFAERWAPKGWVLE